MSRLESRLQGQNYVVKSCYAPSPFEMCATICRLDETLKAMSNDSASKSIYSERQGGRHNSRELVNPNIMQSAPEVGHSWHTVQQILGLTMASPCGTSSALLMKMLLRLVCSFIKLDWNIYKTDSWQLFLPPEFALYFFFCHENWSDSIHTDCSTDNVDNECIS